MLSIYTYHERTLKGGVDTLKGVDGYPVAVRRCLVLTGVPLLFKCGVLVRTPHFRFLSECALTDYFFVCVCIPVKASGL